MIGDDRFQKTILLTQHIARVIGGLEEGCTVDKGYFTYSCGRKSNNWERHWVELFHKLGPFSILILKPLDTY
jgi:hypothetical protein